MSSRVELFVSIVNKLDGPVNQVNATSAVVEQFNTDSTGFELVDQSLQTGAAVASVVSITRLPLGAVPILNIHTNLLAGTTTFLRIVVEVKAGREIKIGDRLALSGNVVGILAAFTALAGAPIAAGFFTAAGVLITATSLYNADFPEKIHEKMLPVLEKLIANRDAGGDVNSWLTSDMGLTPEHLLLPNYQNLIAAVEWDPDAGVVTLTTMDRGRLDSPGNNGVVVVGSTMGPPVIVSEPPPAGPRLDIFIESINGARAGDPYACCGAPQQDRYH